MEDLSFKTRVVIASLKVKQGLPATGGGTGQKMRAWDAGGAGLRGGEKKEGMKMGEGGVTKSHRRLCTREGRQGWSGEKGSRGGVQNLSIGYKGRGKGKRPGGEEIESGSSV